MGTGTGGEFLFWAARSRTFWRIERVRERLSRENTPKHYASAKAFFSRLEGRWGRPQGHYTVLSMMIHRILLD